MSTGMRKWMEKDCPEIEYLSAEVSIGREELRQLRDELAQYKNERDELRAKIEQMERQEPVAWLHETRRDSDVVTDAVKHVWGKAVVGALAAYSIPLYPAPGAQPAPSVPVDVITDYLVSISAHVAHQDGPKAQAEIGELLRMLAAATEAKP